MEQAKVTSSSCRITCLHDQEAEVSRIGCELSAVLCLVSSSPVHFARRHALKLSTAFRSLSCFRVSSPTSLEHADTIYIVLHHGYRSSTSYR